VAGLKGLRRQRVAPSLSAILRKSGLDASRLENAYPEIANQRYRGCAIVKYPDRFETAHAGHEDIDDHQIERRTVESDEAGGAAIAMATFEAIVPEPRLNGEADMRIVIHNQNAAHYGLLAVCHAFDRLD